MVAVLSLKFNNVESDCRGSDETEEEFLHKFRIEVSDLLGRYLSVKCQVTSAGDIDGRDYERLVHRQYHAAVARDALLVAEGARKCRT